MIALLLTFLGAQMIGVSPARVDASSAQQCEDGIDNDGDGAIDHPADPECSALLDDSEAPDPVPTPEASLETAELLRPFPSVRVSGRLTPRGARITRLSVKAPQGAIVRSRCRGARCPFQRTLRYRVNFARVHVRPAQRAYRAGVVLEVFVSAPGQIGKYTRVRIRRGRAPARHDSCATPESGTLPEPMPCD